MPVEQYQGKTFVAFTDIAGFKSMMAEDRALKALDTFYSTGFSVLRNQPTDCAYRVDGFFISDCGVLFVRGREDDVASVRLESLCDIIRQIHRLTFEKAIQLTTSIAWGDFSYDERIEFPGIEKNPIYGNAYVAAFADNEGSTPRLYPSECRLLKKGLPEAVANSLSLGGGDGFVGRIRETPYHFYYEWMRR
jgi:hypothetical protein